MKTQVISNISLDISGKSRDYIVIRAKQGDRSSRFISATIVDGRTPFALGGDETVKLNVARADNIKRSFDGKIETDGKLWFEIPEFALELPYLVTCDVSIISGDYKMKTSVFYIQVDAAAKYDIDAD